LEIRPNHGSKPANSHQLASVLPSIATEVNRIRAERDCAHLPAKSVGIINGVASKLQKLSRAGIQHFEKAKEHELLKLPVQRQRGIRAISAKANRIFRA
jgi:hypothetical protein